ncbi:hypothetical protein ACWD48_05940 [Streptomyces sp. NPDC002519]
MRRRRIDLLGPTMTGLLAAGHFAAFTLLGLTIYRDVASHQDSSWAEPDRPLSQPDPPPLPGSA